MIFILTSNDIDTFEIYKVNIMLLLVKIIMVDYFDHFGFGDCDFYWRAMFKLLQNYI